MRRKRYTKLRDCNPPQNSRKIDVLGGLKQRVLVWKSGSLVRHEDHIEPQVGFTFVKANRAEHTVKMMCEVLKLSRTGYYKLLKRGESGRERRDCELIGHILQIHLDTKGIYGAPRIHS